MFIEPVHMWRSLHLMTPVLIIHGDLFLWHLEPVLEVRITIKVSLPSTVEVVGVVLRLKSMGLHDSEESCSDGNHFHLSILL